MRILALLVGVVAISAALHARQPPPPQPKSLFGQEPAIRAQTNERNIKIETIKPRVALIRNVTGDFSQHVPMFTQLMDYAPRYARLAGMAAGGACFGIYPVDPDTVTNPADLKWQVGVDLGAPQGDDNNDDAFARNGGLPALGLVARVSLDTTQPPPPPVTGRGTVQPGTLPRLPARRPAAPYTLARYPEMRAATLMSDVKFTEFDGMSMYRWMLENGYVQTAPTRMLYMEHQGDPREIPVQIIIPVVERRSGVKLPAR